MLKERTTQAERYWWKGRIYLLYPHNPDQYSTEMERLPPADAPWLPMHMNTLLVGIYSSSTQSESSTRYIELPSDKYMACTHTGCQRGTAYETVGGSASVSLY